jgi:MFS family permease
MTATWMQRIAQDWLVLQLTHSVAAVGVTVAMQFGPMLLFGLYGGVIVDRYPKRTLLMCTQSVVGLCSAVLAVLVLTGSAVVLEVWATAFLIGLVTVIDNPARQVFSNELVGPKHLKNAITLNSSVFQLGALLGPAVSGALIVAVGGGWAFAVNAVACGVTVLVLSRLDTAKLHPITPGPRHGGEVREGLAYVASKPTILWPVILCASLAVFALAMPVLLASFSTQVFHLGAAGYGLFNSLVACGALTGALLSTRRTVLRLRTVVSSGAIWAAVLMVAAVMPSEFTFGIALIATGFANQLFFMSGNPLVQLSSNPAIRGRVMAVWVLVLFGGQAIGGPIMGVIVERVGPHAAMLLGGGVPLLAAGVIALLAARRGDLHVALSHAHRIPMLAIAQR